MQTYAEDLAKPVELGPVPRGDELLAALAAAGAELEAVPQVRVPQRPDFGLRRGMSAYLASSRPPLNTARPNDRRSVIQG